MLARPSLNACVLLGALACALPAPAHEFVATMTLVEDGGALVSRGATYVPAIGVRMRHCDVLHTGPQAFVQAEIDDGGMLELGPQTRFLFDLPYRRDEAPVVGPHYLLSGWVKMTVPRRDKDPPHRINTPQFDLIVAAGVAVIQATESLARVFIESGSAVAVEAGSNARVNLRAGSMYSRSAQQSRGAQINTVARDFVDAMPRAFRDTLQPRLAGLRGRFSEPRPGSDVSPSDLRDWTSASAEARRCLGL